MSETMIEPDETHQSPTERRFLNASQWVVTFLYSHPDLATIPVALPALHVAISSILQKRKTANPAKQPN